MSIILLLVEVYIDIIYRVFKLIMDGFSFHYLKMRGIGVKNKFHIVDR